MLYAQNMTPQPHILYRVPGQCNFDLLQSFEALIPGTLVYGKRSYGRRFRLKNATDDEKREIVTCEIYAPLHAAWLVESSLAHNSLAFTFSATDIDGITGWSNEENQRSLFEDVGRQSSNQSVLSGELREHVLEIATPYQFMGVAWAQKRPWVMNVWACGSGKTLGAIMASLSRPGPVVVVCPAKARHVWWSQVQEYTHIKPYRVRPSSEKRKKHQTFEDYLDECRRESQRPFVVVGAEALVDNISIVRDLKPKILILDEIHTHGSRKRWTAIQEADGSVSFERRKTAASNRANSAINRENRAVAAMDLSRLRSLDLRIGLTATPLDDGRPRRLWSQLDLLAPGGFSHSYSNFAHRYCAARPGQYGGLDDTGASNLAELKARCSFLVHEVPYSESHAALPDTRVQVVYLSSTELNRAERWSDEHTFGQAMKGFVKEARANPLARERVVEARLAEACSRKRKYVVGEALEGLKGGGKVVIFTARRRETELWEHDLRRALKRGDEALGEVPVWMAHGGVPESERDIMVDAFRESKGPCCLVATGQSVGTGVDGMQTADLAIFAMLPWKPGDFVQWKGRFDRLGGSATLLKVVVAQGTYDERVVEILVEKFGPIESFLKADELDGLGDKLLGMEDEGALVSSIISKLEVA
jgi:hypothetical protein